MFDPSAIADEACVEGHLDADPIYGVLLSLGQKQVTGRLTVADAAGDNHMYFMQGRPVGVQLAEHFHPLGQLLLELGKCSGAMFVKAQRLIAEGNRLPGQVYKELDVLDDKSLKDVLAIQARRKAEHFCRLGSRGFTFCRGLTFLTGFTSTPLDPHAVIFLAVRQQMGEQSREHWLDAARGVQLRLVPAGGTPAVGAGVENAGLPAPLAAYGFGPPEDRFLQRLLGGFESIASLSETGTLPRDEMAVLLRYLELIGRLQRRPIPVQPTPTTPPASPPVAQGPERAPPPPPLQLTHTPPPRPTPTTTTTPRAVPRQVTAITAPSPELDALKNLPLSEPSSDDVFSRPGAAVMPRPGVASPTALTDPRRPLEATSEPGVVFASTFSAAQPTPPPPADEVAPVVRKKKVKRSEPLPSEGSGLLVSETRREKTMVAELPTIVVDDDDA